MIPVIAVTDVLEGRADAALGRAAAETGFLTLADVDAVLGLAADRAALLGFFAAPEAVKRGIMRHKFDPTRPNVYRGYFPAVPANGAYTEGVDLGSNLAFPERAGDGSDPLTEPTPVPDIHGWEQAASRYIRGMERLGAALMAGLMRALGAVPERAAVLFERANSTLRLFRYPPLDESAMPEERRVPGADGPDRWLMTQEHTDSGFVTLLWQDGTGGLQARALSGDWVDVPPRAGGLVVNFGQMLGDWSGGRIRATPHRVIAGLAERFSVPFFYEPSVDAVVEPLFPETGAEPFVYGDFLWERMVQFPNLRGVVRKPAGAA